MHKVDNRNLAQKILSRIGKVTSFPVVKPCGFAEPAQSSHNDAASEPHIEHCCSGGYNEAFIFEHWASYGPRH
jgi:hypothetical protein